MHSWVVDFTLCDIDKGERSQENRVVVTKVQSLVSVEDAVSEFAVSLLSTYVINSIKYYGTYINKLK